MSKNTMKCTVCRKEIKNSRPDKKYCSDKCSNKAREQRRSKRLETSSNSSYRYLLIKFLGGECSICGSKDNLVVHHIIPINIGGKNEPVNVMCLCTKCHRNIHTKLFEKVLSRMIEKEIIS